LPYPYELPRPLRFPFFVDAEADSDISGRSLNSESAMAKANDTGLLGPVIIPRRIRHMIIMCILDFVPVIDLIVYRICTRVGCYEGTIINNNCANRESVEKNSIFI
jgi:hypothetical protein